MNKWKGHVHFFVWCLDYNKHSIAFEDDGNNEYDGGGGSGGGNIGIVELG